ncbi:MAG: glycosyltransferase family 2 protein [Anaerolineales bacterium]|nr:glycosyltransferase family 2 protein [Anaerolineales bacterium]
MEISVVICTYNRADILAQALHTACEQTLPDSAYEVIVVDNGSSDHTRSVVEDFIQRYPNVHYCLEEQVGLSHARNRGWQEAQGHYVAYVDDDCKLPQEWLSVAMDVIQRVAPDIFGGPYFPYYNTHKPAWFKDEYGSQEIFKQACVMERGYLSGGNIIIRTGLLEYAGGFSPKLGMSGEDIAYGEETALIRWARVNLPEAVIYYDPQLYVYHLVRDEKMKLRWVLRQQFILGRYTYLAFADGERHNPTLKHLIGLPGLVLLILFEVTIGILLRNRRRYPYYQNYLYEQVFERVVKLGKLYERWRRFLSGGQ